MSVTNEVADDAVLLNIVLNCEQTKSSETKQVLFKSLPTTALEIKKKIEEDFSIPSCVQTLHYQSMILKDSDLLQHTHFRSGDTFTVDYPIEAECELTRKALDWIKDLLELLETIEKNIQSIPKIVAPDAVSRLKHLTWQGIDDGIVKILSVTIFLPREDKRKVMNRSYFRQEGGLAALMKTYGVLVSQDWGDLGFEREFHIYLEGVCSQAICNYAQGASLSRQIVQLGGLEMCTKTLLRKRLLGDEGVINISVYEHLVRALNAVLK